MAGNRHVINAEGLLVNVLGHGNIDHFQIAFRPDRRDPFQTAVARQKPVVAQLGVGLVPVIEVRKVVVIGGGIVIQLLELMPHGQEHILIDGLLHAHAHIGRHQTDHIGELAGGGTAAPCGLVVVGKLDAFGSHPVQSGCPLRVDDLLCESLGGDEDQVFPCKHAGVFVLFGGSQGRYVLADGVDAAVAGVCDQGIKVNVHHVVTVDDRLRFRRGGFLRGG